VGRNQFEGDYEPVLAIDVVLQLFVHGLNELLSVLLLHRFLKVHGIGVRTYEG
jgi:hypothetical protein